MTANEASGATIERAAASAQPGTDAAIADFVDQHFDRSLGAVATRDLSAILFEREEWNEDTRTGTYHLNGMIFPGPLPPGR